MEVKISLNETDQRIRPGMFITIKIVTEKKDDVVKIPVDCAVKRFGEDYVFVLNSAMPSGLSGDIIKNKLIKNLDIDNAFVLLDSCGIDTSKLKEEKKKNKKNPKIDEVITKKMTALIDAKKNYSIDSSDKSKLRDILNTAGYFTVEKRKIKPGIQIDEKLEVIEGLSPGEEIVVRGQTLLEDKTRVKIIDRIEPLSQDDMID